MKVPAALVRRDAPHGMVCSVDHLASSAGVAMLRAGGSAADAAVATSAVLAVTTQNMCGMGGDLFALVHYRNGQPPACLNASGRAGSGADPERLRAEGHSTMPFRGDIRSVPVPGCVDGWLSLHGRFGRLPLADVLAPAIDLAENGFPAAPLLAAAVPVLAGVAGAEDFTARTVSVGTRIRRPGFGPLATGHHRGRACRLVPGRVRRRPGPGGRRANTPRPTWPPLWRTGWSRPGSTPGATAPG